MAPPFLVSPRLHLFEINDQSWFPNFLRNRVQACLTVCWLLHLPILQTAAPASLAAQTLQRLLGPLVARYTYVDFCAGAGGPTSFVEQELNARLAEPLNGGSKDPEQVDFVVTDIAPHLPAWTAAAAKSPHLHYVPGSVNAAAAPDDLLEKVTLSPLASADDAEAAQARARLRARKPFRLFFLAFHHFPDPLARAILKDTLATADGFAIFELQDRTPGSFVTTILLFPLMWLISPIFFWNDPVMLVFMYLLPIVPFVVSFDGIISSLRTRTAEEIRTLIAECGGDAAVGWSFRDGAEWHTKPIGRMNWFVGMRD
jgi:hypothetical protein